MYTCPEYRARSTFMVFVLAFFEFIATVFEPPGPTHYYTVLGRRGTGKV